MRRLPTATALFAATLVLPLALTACGRAMDHSEIDKEMDAYAASQAAAESAATKANADFLAKAAKTPGVVTLPSGLMYRIVSDPNPNAPQPSPNDTVTIMYEGTLVDGKVFDSSYARNQPATFPLPRLIKAWQIGIPLMHKGDTYMLFVPPELGYGAEGAGEDIPPNSPLIFKIQLLDIQGK